MRNGFVSQSNNVYLISKPDMFSMALIYISFRFFLIFIYNTEYIFFDYELNLFSGGYFTFCLHLLCIISSQLRFYIHIININFVFLDLKKINLIFLTSATGPERYTGLDLLEILS